MNYYKIIYSPELKHHGIKGQKWGIMNGPPYPLNEGDHSTSEKKAGWKSSLRKANKTAKKQKMSKEDIDNHRQYLIAKADIRGDKDSVKLYKEATDKQIEKDLINRENVKKALIAGTVLVGAVGAGYLIYKAKEAKVFDVVKAGDWDDWSLEEMLDFRRNVKIDNLLEAGLNLDTSNKIVRVLEKDGMIDDYRTSIIRIIADSEFDIEFPKGQTFGRVDFHKDFDLEKAKKFLYMTVSERDHNIYKNVLPNRTGLDEGQYEIFMEATKDLRLPSLKKTHEILGNLYVNDKEFARQVDNAHMNMIRHNLKMFYGYTDGQIDGNPFLKLAMKRANNAMKSQEGLGYFSVVSLTGDESMHSKVSQEFMKRGYNAIFDTHDIHDELTSLPIINLDNNNLTMIGKELVQDMF